MIQKQKTIVYLINNQQHFCIYFRYFLAFRNNFGTWNLTSSTFDKNSIQSYNYECLTTTPIDNNNNNNNENVDNVSYSFATRNDNFFYCWVLSFYINNINREIKWQQISLIFALLSLFSGIVWIISILLRIFNSSNLLVSFFSSFPVFHVSCLSLLS